MSDALLEQATRAASVTETMPFKGEILAAMPIRVKRGHLALLDWGREPASGQAVKPRRRRLRLGPYEIAIILLMASSLAATVTCLLRAGWR